MIKTLYVQECIKLATQLWFLNSIWGEGWVWLFSNINDSKTMLCGPGSVPAVRFCQKMEPCIRLSKPFHRTLDQLINEITWLTFKKHPEILHGFAMLVPLPIFFFFLRPIMTMMKITGVKSFMWLAQAFLQECSKLYEQSSKSFTGTLLVLQLWAKFAPPQKHRR